MGRDDAQWKGFVQGGAAAMVAGFVTHPLDLIKVRMQLQGETLVPLRLPSLLNASVTGGNFVATLSPPASAPAFALPRPGVLAVAHRVVQSEGASGLFSGASATVLRQGLYSSTRLGIYEILKNALEEPSKPGEAKTGFPLYKKVTAGLFSGAVGAAVGNPADLAMVRMQADGRLPLELRRNYKNVGDAIVSVVRNEGVGGLWRGCGPTVQRAMVVTASQLATYDQAKEAILARRLMKDGFGTHVASSFAAGFVAAVTSNPLDVIKTRLMNMKLEEGKAAPYKSGLDCAIKTVQSEGIMALYKGFVPTITRQWPFTMVLFVSLEQMKKVLERF